MTSILSFTAHAAHAMTAEEIEAYIWEKEFAIFEGRSEGDLTNYISVMSDHYMGWPQVLDTPIARDRFMIDAELSKALKGEVTTVTKNGFTLHEGTTAIAYFTTHRTRLGDGMAPEGERDVDEYYENIHVWTMEEDEWRLMGGAARLMDGPREP